MALVEPRPVKLDRDGMFLEYTKSICPVCKTVVDAEVNIRDNRVILRKHCHEHGLFEALVHSDAELYLFGCVVGWGEKTLAHAAVMR